MLEAYEADEWQCLAELDKECQQTVTQIIADDPRAMFEELRDMLGFYSQLVQRCSEQRDVYADQVRQFRQARQGQSSYQEFQNISVVN